MVISDQIKKEIVLNVPVERVWQAVSNADEFGTWFGVKFDGCFEAGKPATGKIRPTAVDPDIAAMQEPYAGTPFTIHITDITAPYRFAFQWHPFAIDREANYSHEPMTAITFELTPRGNSVLLTITEAGFDGIPAARRAQAYEADNEGWAMQTQLLASYLQQDSA